MAGRAGGGHSRRDGPREPTTHPACEGTGRAVRDASAADGEPRGRTGRKSEPPPGKDGVRMEVKAGYKHTEVGVIPEDWEVATLAAICSMKSGEGITSASIDQFSKYPCYGGN